MKSFEMYQSGSLWTKAHEQAAHIPYIKDKRAKRKQESMLLETLKRALRGGM